MATAAVEVHGTVTLGDVTVAARVDSGATTAMISGRVARATGFITVPMSKRLRVRIADGSIIEATEMLMVPLMHFVRPNGRHKWFRNFDVVIVEGLSDDEMLLGLQFQRQQLGVDVLEAVDAVLEPPDDDAEPVSADSAGADSAACAASVEEDENEYQFGTASEEADAAVVASLMTNISRAVKEGLSEASAERLQEAVLGEFRDLWRAQLQPDPPAKVPPIEVLIDEEKWRRKVLPARKYDASSAYYMERMAAKLVDIGYCKYAPWETRASPAYPVPKADAKPGDPIEAQARFTIDYRWLNFCTQLEQPNLPVVQMFDSYVHGCKFFGKLDLFNGYWQLPLSERSKRFFAFRTDRCVLIPERLTQGGTNAPGYFQSAMNDALRGLVGSACIVFMDDILIYGKTEEQFIDNWIAVLRRLNEFGFKCSSKKSVFCQREVLYCGRVYSQDGVKYNPEYIRALIEMPTPVNGADLRVWMMSCNWVRSAVKGFAELLLPFTDIWKRVLKLAGSQRTAAVKKVQLLSVGWNAEIEQAFRRMNRAVANASMVAYPDPGKTVLMFTDASDRFYSAVIVQCDASELRKENPMDMVVEPLAWMSGEFKGAAANYPTVEKEGFAIREGMLKHSHLFRSATAAHVYTDHRNLGFIFNPDVAIRDGRRVAAARLERWAESLRPFNFVIHYVKGEWNVPADMLTRSAASEGARASPVMVNAMAATVVQRPPAVDEVNADDIPTVAELVTAQSEERTAEECVRAGLIRRDDGVWTTTGGRVWVPRARLMQWRFFIACHGGALGHRGVDVTVRAMEEHCWFEGLRRLVEWAVKCCPFCSKCRGGKLVNREWGSTRRATRSNQTIHFDYYFVEKAVKATPGGYEYILVLKDQFSRFVRLIPTASANAETTARALMNWFSDFGLVFEWVSDQGPHFVDAVLQRVQQLCGAEHHFTAKYASWSNGVIERTNRDVREVLSAVMTEGMLPDSDWPYVLPVVSSVLNGWKTDALLGHSPREVMCGVTRFSVMNVVYGRSKNDVTRVDVDTEEFRALLQRAAVRVHELETDINDRLWSARRVEEAPIDGEQWFNVGDYVMTAVLGDSKKKATRPIWDGPAVVKERRHDRRYVVEDLGSRRTQELNARHLKFFADKDLVVTARLREIAAFGGKGFVVDHFCGHRNDRGYMELLVVWSGLHGDEWEPTWQRYDDMMNEVPVLVKRYVKLLSQAERAKFPVS